MPRARQITRTITTTMLIVKVVNVAEEKFDTTEITVSGEVKDNAKATRIAHRILDTDTIKVVSAECGEVSTNIYAMDEAVFIQNATVINTLTAEQETVTEQAEADSESETE